MNKKNGKKNVKNNNQQGGFTLIELLAVITIMGILMMVAIPAVSRTIENSRRNTFANTAQQYITAVSNAVSADEISCNGQVASALSNGCYYYSLNTTDSGSNTLKNQTLDLLEKGGKSSFGNSDVNGYVAFYKSNTTSKTTYQYAVFLMDSAGNGINKLTNEVKVSRSAVLTGQSKNTTTAPTNSIKFPPASGSDQSCTWTACVLN